MVSSKNRLPIIGVMGSGTCPHSKRAVAIGKWLAEAGMNLLTGGGGGVMASVSEAFHAVSDRKGIVIGIIPGNMPDHDYTPCNGYPNPWIEIPIYTHLPYSGVKGQDPMSRNHINILSSNVIIALPGGAGTASEIMLAKKYSKPLIAYLKTPDEIEGIPAGTLISSNFKDIQDFVLTHVH